MEAHGYLPYLALVHGRPHVGGAAALYLQSNPGASPAAVVAAIVNNATDGSVSDAGPGSPNGSVAKNILATK